MSSLAVAAKSFEKSDLLDIAYQVGRTIHSEVTTEVGPQEKPWSDYPDYFKSGPNSCYNQTKGGLVLKVVQGVPCHIDTPYGEWLVLGSTRGNFSKALEAVSKYAELKLMKEERSSTGHGTKYYEITKWKGRELPSSTYAHLGWVPPNERSEVPETWKVFLSSQKF